MSSVVVQAFITLDGVVQGGGGPDEDREGGFEHGGWMMKYDEQMDKLDEGGKIVAEWESRTEALLLGRKTYEIFAAHWPYAAADDPIAVAFNRTAKYVLTRSGQPLAWANSHRLPDIEAVAALKAGEGPDLLIQGSSTLYPPLLAQGLIDRLFVMTFPVILGGGKRLLGPGSGSTALKLVEHQVATTGVIIATYEPAGPVPIGSFQHAEPSPAEAARQERMKREG
jgi:dihydrofolate reductase